MPQLVSALVIDDEPVVRSACQRILSERGFTVKCAASGGQAMDLIREESFDLVLLDLLLPGQSGLETLHNIKRAAPATTVIIISAHATVAATVEAMKLGAYDLLPKPFTPEELTAIINRSLDNRRLGAENAFLRAELGRGRDVELGVSLDAAVRQLYETVGRVSATDAVVFITGESGAGKEFLARAIHRYSLRCDGLFVVVDCERTLVGLSDKLAPANGGTLFLDEVGELSEEAQAELLRTKSDARIIAASSRDLAADAAAGSLRAELFDRLRAVSLKLPPLRERKEDIPNLAAHFLAKHAQKRRKAVAALTAEAMQKLLDYSWPGNIRELELVIERAVMLAGHALIGPQDIPPLDMAAAAKPEEEPAVTTLAEAERGFILRALQACGGNKTKAAERLGIDRKTLHLKLKSYGLQVERDESLSGLQER